jgi:hypothetical protein
MCSREQDEVEVENEMLNVDQIEQNSTEETTEIGNNICDTTISSISSDETDVNTVNTLYLYTYKIYIYKYVIYV